MANELSVYIRVSAIFGGMVRQSGTGGIPGPSGTVAAEWLLKNILGEGTAGYIRVHLVTAGYCWTLCTHCRAVLYGRWPIDRMSKSGGHFTRERGNSLVRHYLKIWLKVEGCRLLVEGEQRCRAQSEHG
jgi:hypothetical protein